MFKVGRVEALVATDVAARGIHVDGVACVVALRHPRRRQGLPPPLGSHRPRRRRRPGRLAGRSRPTPATVARMQRDLEIPAPMTPPDVAAIKDSAAKPGCGSPRTSRWSVVASDEQARRDQRPPRPQRHNGDRYMATAIRGLRAEVARTGVGPRAAAPASRRRAIPWGAREFLPRFRRRSSSWPRAAARSENEIARWPRRPRRTRSAPAATRGPTPSRSSRRRHRRSRAPTSWSSACKELHDVVRGQSHLVRGLRRGPHRPRRPHRPDHGERVTGVHPEIRSSSRRTESERAGTGSPLTAVGMRYRRMPIEVESPEQLGYDTITNNLSESSVSDRRLADLGLDLTLAPAASTSCCSATAITSVIPCCARRSRRAAPGLRRRRRAGDAGRGRRVVRDRDRRCSSPAITRSSCAPTTRPISRRRARSAPSSTSSTSRSTTRGGSTSSASRRACGPASPS